MVEFSRRTRKKAIDDISEKHVQCLVIGGGIVGAGVAGVLSSNGISTILADKGDFASGTSSGSSKLIHGGIRYLAQGYFRLTRDLLRERNYLLKNSELVNRLDFDILVDNYSWSPLYMRIGLLLYSVLGGRPSLPRMIRNRGEYPEAIRGYFPYFDGLTDDSRLVIYNIVSAHRAGAVCLNYAEVTGMQDVGNAVEVKLLDSLNQNKVKVSADVVINASGPWINHVLHLYRSDKTVPLKLSKGVHVVVDKEKAYTSRAVTFRSHIDRRQMFIIPRDHVSIIGTTDRIVESPDDLSVPDEDVDYIIESARRILPGISRSDVLGSYSGIRPLVGKGSNPDRISRDFSLFVHGRMISVAGVKLTDFRTASRKIAGRAAGIGGWDINTSNLPMIKYSRPLEGDVYRHEIENECAIFPEDIMRRREGVEIYDPKNKDTVLEKVLGSFRIAGNGDEE